MMKRIAVLMGGVSSERDVSVQSGENVVRALASLGTYDVVPVVLDEESLDAMPKDVDAVYIALHGGWGENGGVQAALNGLNIPYTGPGVLASQVAMDKVKTKMVLEMKNVPTAAWGLAGPDAAVSPLPLPVVVKPPCDGSSVGISKVARPEEWKRALDLAFSAQGSEKPVLVEEFVPGREFTVAVVDGEAWPVLEIVAPGGWYGYEEKYVSDETRYPFLEEGDLAKKLRQTAIDAYRAVGCRGVTRVDFRVSPLGRCYVLELNTSPGFTAHSLVPKAGMHTGLTFAGVCDRILQSAAVDRT
ncbi:MAG: D-alanine--D-alanine ligase [Kiritimatiellae bacterium]|nr:D-alanine--D-alanine ligase [Kiritimatiellia bacterium]